MLRRDARERRPRFPRLLVLLRQRVSTTVVVEYVRVAWRGGTPALKLGNGAGCSERKRHALIAGGELHRALQASQCRGVISLPQHQQPGELDAGRRFPPLV